jgi:predicted tellurium resistance membrane protein TerC
MAVRRHEPTIAQFLGVIFAVAIVAKFSSSASQSIDQLRDVALCVGAFLISIGASIFHYRVISTSHPLHSVPGPFLAKVTQFWLFKVVLK